MSEKTIEVLWPAMRRGDVFLTDVINDVFMMFKLQTGTLNARLVCVRSSDESHTGIKTGTLGNMVRIEMDHEVPVGMVLVKIALPTG